MKRTRAQQIRYNRQIAKAAKMYPNLRMARKFRIPWWIILVLAVGAISIGLVLGKLITSGLFVLYGIH